jgi:hypothetical protein
VKNSSSNNNSHNKVLILGAICISIIAGVVSYKVADYRSKQDEIKQKRAAGFFNITGEKEDPTITKILSAIDSSELAAGTSTEEDPFTITDKDNATSRLAKQVYSDYVNQEAGNSDLNVGDIANNAIGQLSSSDLPRSKYGINSIAFTAGSSLEEIRLYGNNFAEIYMRNMRIIANNQQKYSNSLSEIASIYENISKELLKIKVPPQISSSHLAIVNNYQIIADSFRLINIQSQDPVKSLLGVKSSKEAIADNDQMFINISKYFKNNDIIFGNNEVGVIWNSN